MTSPDHPLSLAQPERREFVRVAMMLGLGCVGIGAGVYTIASRLPASVQAGVLPLLPLEEALKRKVGSWVNLAVTVARRDGYKLVTREQHLYFKRAKEGQTEDCFAALSSICPHAGCGVDLLHGKDEPDRFRCACHNAKFTGEGAVESGPAPRAMDGLKLSVGDHEGKRWLMVEWKDFLPGSAEKKERG
ncbi:MAG: Rieske (2Fe-2S) protein [Planctomycetes bacterium]|nr:Rieske (2Fe-2S) protein [Planctomycetota bacterium]